MNVNRAYLRDEYGSCFEVFNSKFNLFEEISSLASWLGNQLETFKEVFW